MQGWSALIPWPSAVGDVAVGEFVVIAALTANQWYRHRARGGGWSALAFGILAISAVAGRTVSLLHPSASFVLPFAKALFALLLLIPLCLFEFAAAFRPARAWRHWLAGGLTLGAVAFTAALAHLPVAGLAAPPHFVAYRLAIDVLWALLLTDATVRLWMAGGPETTMAVKRMRIFAGSTGALDILVVGNVAGLGSHRAFFLASEALIAAIGALLTLAVPSFVGGWWSRREDEEFQRAIEDLVSVEAASEVAPGVLPHACALVGARSAALVDEHDNVVAQYSVGHPGATTRERARTPLPLRAAVGPAHHLTVEVDPYMHYFGRVELRYLDALTNLVQLATERCDAKAALTHQMLHDSLTELPNRDLFLDRLSQALAVLDRHEATLAVMFIDLDRFKQINDRIDHAAGDVVLQEVARRLTAAVRAGDTVARIGGDEFVAVMEVGSESDAHALADSICAAVSAPIMVGERTLSVTASIGLVVTRDRNAHPATLLRDADWAMYLAKEAGRDNVKMFEEHVRDLRLGRMDLERELLHAIDDGQMRLQYQPIYRLEDGIAVGVEALVRWQHPERGLLFPDSFVPMAEESGLIVQLGAWILSEACRQAAEWLEDLPGDAPFTMWVNSSAGQFHRTDVVQSVLDVLDSTGLEPSTLGVEITETVFMSDKDRLRTTMSDLNWNGVSLAIDDFGTGFSSLSYLKRFPVDILKVDRSFVQGIGQEPETSLVSATLAMANSLGILTVAEGVESLEQGEWLRRAGCEHVQGYAYCRPQDPNAAHQALVESRSTPTAGNRFEAYRELTATGAKGRQRAKRTPSARTPRRDAS
ncbi:MAG TPA: bifunctional diguanylate cyclase/phosphodiesterase [Acidimicrobiales bacterium]|nr:bifunctional diguanylate cyclase/phosphodiesterase [Acidimicrobiales bacterium]